MKTVILDMYGVIMKDPEGGLVPFVNKTFLDLKIEDIYIHWTIANVGGMTSPDFFKNIGFEGDLGRIEREYLDTVEIDECFYEAASKLRNHYRLALLSNDLAEWSEYLRDKFKINDFFDVIAVSGELKMKKPDPRIFGYMLKKLGQPASECVFVDDRRRNLAAARSLGMDTILFNSRKVPYDGKTVDNFGELVDMLISDQ